MEKLFSYGTLQLDQVQQSTFGRLLEGAKDTLLGYNLSTIKITDPVVIEKSGTDIHPILRFTGALSDEVDGTVFDVSQHELKQADEYEVDDYTRISVKLKSGVDAWMYVANS